MRRERLFRINALLGALALSLMATAGWSQSLTWLGTLGGDNSTAYGVSADGSVVVGMARTAAGRWRAFRWTEEGMQDLGTLGGDNSMAYGVSADGSVVVGWAGNAAGRWRAFRWENGVMQNLGTLGGDNSMAYGVSADGSVVVGMARTATGQLRAFRWENGVMQNLGPQDIFPSYAYGVSADGRVVVGRVGLDDYSGPSRAFRWENGVMQNLGTLGGDNSTAYGVSADGRVVVGSAFNAAWQPRAFRWMATSGMEDLNITYAHLLTPGSVLQRAYAISPDGRYIVGEGYNAATGRTEAFLLNTGFPRPGDVDRNGCVDDADLLAVLFAFGGQGYRNEDLNWDGTVDNADLLVVLFNFGSGC